MVTQGTEQQVQIAVSLLQALLVVLPFLLTATQYIFSSEYWSNTKEGTVPDMVVPGMILVAYWLLILAMGQITRYLASAVVTSEMLQTALQFLFTFGVVIFILIAFPIIMKPRNKWFKAINLVLFFLMMSVIVLWSLTL